MGDRKYDLGKGARVTILEWKSWFRKPCIYYGQSVLSGLWIRITLEFVMLRQHNKRNIAVYILWFVLGFFCQFFDPLFQTDSRTNLHPKRFGFLAKRLVGKWSNPTSFYKNPDQMDCPVLSNPPSPWKCSEIEFTNLS